MINKIEGLSNEYFKSRVGHVTNLSDYMPRNNQVFYTLEIKVISGDNPITDWDGYDNLPKINLDGESK